MTSEELAADLYGDRGQSGAARVEMSRLRKLPVGAIDTEPYRLAMDIESDVARVRGLLDRGEVREAVEHYDGPMLPHSEAPGIAREREALVAWVHQAVMSADDREALWTWVQCPRAETSSRPGSACSRGSTSATRAAASRRHRSSRCAPSTRPPEAGTPSPGC
jgi:hypothetical protein